MRRPELISELAQHFGTQCIVVAIDAKQIEDEWVVHLVGGRVPTERSLFEWAAEAVERGAGELLFTSMDRDGTKLGFANKALKQLSKTVSVPVIASGGAGEMSHFVDTFVEGNADAALAASVFHFKEIGIPELKKYLDHYQIPVR